MALQPIPDKPEPLKAMEAKIIDISKKMPAILSGMFDDELIGFISWWLGADSERIAESYLDRMEDE